MAYQKGKSGNPNGRPKGAKNKTSEEIKILLSEFISTNIEGLQTEYDKLKPEMKLQFFEKVIKFIVPRPLNIEHTGEIGVGNNIHISYFDLNESDEK